ncbi:MAG: hypothetical protein V1876_04125 [Candidatus Peregrinibacteria bacterium]
MDGILPFLRQQRIFVFSCAALAFAILVAFAPSLGHPFMSDDYHALSALSGQQWDLHFFFTGSGKYPIPVTKLLWASQYALFGTQAQGYHLISLLLHLLNTTLVVVFFARLLKSKWAGLLTGAFFALSASHWRTTMWMSAQMKMLAAFFLLLALLSFLSFLRTGRWRFFVITLIAQIGMPFASAHGVELPVVLAPLYLFLRHTDEKHTRVPSQRVWWLIASLLTLAFVYVLLERLLYAHANAYLLSDEGMLQAGQNLLRAAHWLLLGLFEGLARSSTGLFIGAVPSIFSLHAATVPRVILLLPAGILTILLLLPRRRGWILPALLFAAWTVLLYAPPILPDMAQGLTEEWFITRARYFYVPAIPAAALLAVLVTNVKLPRRRPIARISAIAVLTLFCTSVLLSNLGRIQQLERYAATYTQEFGRVRDTYVQDLHTLLGQTWGTRVVTIRDELLGVVTGIDYAAHNVYPSHLAQIYLSTAERASFRFLPVGVPADYVVTGQGTLWPPVAGR